MKKTMQQFIDDHRGELDERIRKHLGKPNYPLDDEDREEWIANKEDLYLWAKAEGVDV